eukprot:PhF_6_TR41563/c0_g1_i2/m.62969
MSSNRSQPCVASVIIQGKTYPSVKHPHVTLNLGVVVSAAKDMWNTTRIPIHRKHMDRELSLLHNIDKTITTQEQAFGKFEAECRQLCQGSKFVFDGVAAVHTNGRMMRGVFASAEAACKRALQREVEWDEVREKASSEAEGVLADHKVIVFE